MKKLLKRLFIILVPLLSGLVAALGSTNFEGCWFNEENNYGLVLGRLGGGLEIGIEKGIFLACSWEIKDKEKIIIVESTVSVDFEHIKTRYRILGEDLLERIVDEGDGEKYVRVVGNVSWCQQAENLLGRANHSLVVTPLADARVAPQL